MSNQSEKAQSEKARSFRALHEETFVIANAWDAGSARILAALGFKALATSSGACAGVLGRLDGMVTREEAFAHCKAIVDATDLPVSARIWRRASATRRRPRRRPSGWPPVSVSSGRRSRMPPAIRPGRCSIRPRQGSYRRRRGSRAITAVPLTLTARTENYLRGNPDLDDTIRRLQSFQAAGADVLMAPGLPDLESVRAVCAALSRPVNFMAGIQRKIVHRDGTLRGWSEARQPCDITVSRGNDWVGECREEVSENGTFDYLKNTLATPAMNAFMKG